MDTEFLNRQKHDFFRDISAFGSVWVYLIAVVFFLIAKEYAAAKKLIIGLIVIYCVIALIRFFYFKKRPVEIKYNSLIGKLDASSFPSMHAARIIFISADLIANYKNPIFNVAMIIIASLVIYSRIKLKKHDVIDVLAGVFVGVCIFFIINRNI